MAPVTVDPAATDRLTAESIPVIDLRRFTQSELMALSRCSAHAVDFRRCDDLLIPKIDRSVFNESAGSRKQTYSRFRLARRKPTKPLPLARPGPGPVQDDPERLDNASIIALFKQLFNADSQAAELVPVSVEYSEKSFPRLSYAADDGGEVTRKRGRKPKTASASLAVEGSDKAMVLYDNRGEGKEKEIVNKNGAVVDLVELAKLEDPFAAEIRRRTDGMDKDEQLLGFLTALDGQWGSRRKRRKIVDANEFGDALPNGWKVLLGMKKKQGQCWLFCRRYISPDGRYFMSCKEVSSYLMSLLGFPDVKPLPLGQSSEASQMETKPVAVNAETTHCKDQKAFSISSVTSEPCDHGKQTTLEKDVHMGAIQETRLFKCHKCSAPFYEKNHLLHHLLSCHKRKRRKSGMPVEDDELTKVGHYECQFCDRRFTERVCFFVHVGIHVKNYVKSIDESPGVASMEKGGGGVSISTSGVPPVILEKPESMEVDGDSVACTPDIAPSSGPNVDSSGGKFQTESDPKDHAGHGDHEAVMSSVDGDQINMATGIDKGVGASSDKGDTVPEVVDEELGGTENSIDTAKAKLDFSSADENIESSNVKIDTCQTSIEIMEATRDIHESKSLVQVSEVENSAALINSGHGLCNDRMNGPAEQSSSKHELLDNNKNESRKEKAETRSFSDDVAEAIYSEEKHKTVDDKVIFDSYGSEIGKKLGVVNDARQEISSAGRSLVPQGKGETALLPESSFVRNTEQCSLSSTKDNLQRCVVEDDAKRVLISASSEVGTSNFRKNEVSFDAGGFNSNGRVIQSLFALPGEEITSVVPDNANTVSAFRKVEPRRDGGSVNISFPSTILVHREEQPYGTESSGPCKTSSVKEPNCEEVAHSTDLLNPKSSSDPNLTNREVNVSSYHLNSPPGGNEAPNNSNVYGACNAATKESKKNRDSRSDFSCLSVGGNADGVISQIHGMRDNMNGNSSAPCATHHRNLRVDRTGSTDKVILEFGSSISGIDTGVLPSFPSETIPVNPSPFTLWNDQPFGVEQNQSRVCDSSREGAQQDQVSQINSLSLATFQQTCNVGYNLNETYISTVDSFSRLNALETHRDTDLMIGFRNLNGGPTQDVVTEDLWRSNDGNALPSGVGDSSSSQGQLTGEFRPFDFLSDKGENDIFTVNEKFDSISNFGGLRTATVEPTEFSFLTPQESNPQLGDPKVLSYGNAAVEQGFESSVWLGKDASLPNMNTRNSFSTLCVWCGSAFQQESIDSDTQAGSIGYLCPTCKAKMSGQFL